VVEKNTTVSEGELTNMNRRRNAVACLILVLILVLVLASSTACEPAFNLVIENQTTQTLTIYLNGGSFGTVKAGEQITIKSDSATGKYSIMAKSAQGETVFSKTFTVEQMQIVDSKTYKIVITTQ
jgi:hypothetical protein